MSDTQSVTFREAAPVETTAPVTTNTTPDPTTQSAKSDFSDAPPSLYAELQKKPYSVKHLDLDLYYSDPDFPEIREQAEALDQYVLKQMKARGLKDDAGSYKEVLEAIYKQIGKSANEDPVKALKRLSVAAGAIERLESAKLPPVLSAKTLSPTEFEEVLP